jgi:hypothetical protein
MPKQKAVKRIIRMGITGMDILPLEPRIPYNDSSTKNIRNGITGQAVLNRIFCRIFRFSHSR